MSSIHDAFEFLADRPNRRMPRTMVQDIARAVFRGEVTTPQLAAFLMALRVAGETAHEVEAFVEVMLDNATPFPKVARDRPLVDTCGTGGDGHYTFNISTGAALIVAAAGTRVAKHGNRSASSKCGSADVLEALGVNIELSPERSAEQLEKFNFCFLFARTYHPAMKHATPARKELGTRTLFNLCGPLSNPARPTHQIVGVPSYDLIEPMAQALRMLGGHVALVFHGADGMDEISMTQVTEGLYLDDNGTLRPWYISPPELGLQAVEMAEFVGGEPEDNAKILRAALEGEKGPHADILNLNAAAALWISGVDRDMSQSFKRARDVQESGAPARLLDKLIEDGKAG